MIKCINKSYDFAEVEETPVIRIATPILAKYSGDIYLQSVAITSEGCKFKTNEVLTPKGIIRSRDMLSVPLSSQSLHNSIKNNFTIHATKIKVKNNYETIKDVYTNHSCPEFPFNKNNYKKKLLLRLEKRKLKNITEFKPSDIVRSIGCKPNYTESLIKKMASDKIIINGKEYDTPPIISIDTKGGIKKLKLNNMYNSQVIEVLKDIKEERKNRFESNFSNQDIETYYNIINKWVDEETIISDKNSNFSRSNTITMPEKNNYNVKTFLNPDTYSISNVNKENSIHKNIQNLSLKYNVKKAEVRKMINSNMHNAFDIVLLLPIPFESILIHNKKKPAGSSAIQGTKERLEDSLRFLETLDLNYEIVDIERRDRYYGNSAQVRIKPNNEKIYNMNIVMYKEKRNPFNDESKKLGEILGYPECCVKSFHKGGTDKGYKSKYVAHIPCTQNCDKTIELNKERKDVFENYFIDNIIL